MVRDHTTTRKEPWRQAGGKKVTSSSQLLLWHSPQWEPAASLGDEDSVSILYREKRRPKEYAPEEVACKNLFLSPDTLEKSSTKKLRARKLLNKHSPQMQNVAKLAKNISFLYVALHRNQLYLRRRSRSCSCVQKRFKDTQAQYSNLVQIPPLPTISTMIGRSESSRLQTHKKRRSKSSRNLVYQKLVILSKTGRYTAEILNGALVFSCKANFQHAHVALKVALNLALNNTSIHIRIEQSIGYARSDDSPCSLKLYTKRIIGDNFQIEHSVEEMNYIFWLPFMLTDLVQL